MMEQMTLSELKTGMHVVTREGSEFVVLKDTLFAKEDVLVTPHDEDNGNGDWLPLSNYNDNLTFRDTNYSCFDIVRVYQPKYAFTALEYKLDCCPEYYSDMIFAEQIMTKAEAEQKFGIRIVD